MARNRRGRDILSGRDESLQGVRLGRILGEMFPELQATTRPGDIDYALHMGGGDALASIMGGIKQMQDENFRQSKLRATMENAAANRDVAARDSVFQDMTKRRGQDITSATSRRGQDKLLTGKKLDVESANTRLDKGIQAKQAMQAQKTADAKEMVDYRKERKVNAYGNTVADPADTQSSGDPWRQIRTKGTTPEQTAMLLRKDPDFVAAVAKLPPAEQDLLLDQTAALVYNGKGINRGQHLYNLQRRVALQSDNINPQTGEPEQKAEKRPSGLEVKRLGAKAGRGASLNYGPEGPMPQTTEEMTNAMVNGGLGKWLLALRNAEPQPNPVPENPYGMMNWDPKYVNNMFSNLGRSGGWIE